MYVVFNVITNLTTQDEQIRCFENAAAHLRPGGAMVAEVFVPQLQRLPRGERYLPAGAAFEIERSLPALGFEGIQDVRVGKSFRFHVEADDEASATTLVQDVCARFLTNPGIEDSSITVTTT